MTQALYGACIGCFDETNAAPAPSNVSPPAPSPRRMHVQPASGRSRRRASTGARCTPQPAVDLIFLTDTSTSMVHKESGGKPNNLFIMRNFIQSTIAGLASEVDAGEVRVGLATFDSHAKTQIRCGQISSASELVRTYIYNMCS